MKTGVHVLLIAVALSAGLFLAGRAHGQSSDAPGPAETGGFSCSPAPCVLPPTQASEGGNIVTDSPVVTNPLNRKELLLGSFDGNCQGQFVLGFHLSRDGGSTWNRVECMPAIITNQRVYLPDFDPLVGYDRNGVAFIAGDYGDSQGFGYGFVGFQKSADGTHFTRLN
jgi:hypothetical protein